MKLLPFQFQMSSFENMAHLLISFITLSIVVSESQSIILTFSISSLSLRLLFNFIDHLEITLCVLLVIQFDRENVVFLITLFYYNCIYFSCVHVFVCFFPHAFFFSTIFLYSFLSFFVFFFYFLTSFKI